MELDIVGLMAVASFAALVAAWVVLPASRATARATAKPAPALRLSEQPAD